MKLHEIIRDHYPEYYSIERYSAAQTVCIRKTSEEWGWLGNFYRTPISIDGVTLTGGKKPGFAEEKAAAHFLDEIGVFCNVWPQAQNKPDGLRNCAVFNPDRVRVVKVEHIDIERKKDKYVLKNRTLVE